MQPVEKRDPLRVTAIIFTVALHALVLGGMYIARVMGRGAHTTLNTMTFVDAQLVRFGKPRDLSFLPHKEGHVKDKPADIKIAKDMNALAHPEEKKKEDVDPLKKTHAELFKTLDDDREGQTTNEGQLTGSKAGTATEAKGDPYILELVNVIGSAWTLPTTLKDSDVASLSADVCLTIGESGVLTSYKIMRGSGNSQFDSSLQAALSLLTRQQPPPLPAPPNRDLQTPSGPRNLRNLATSGRLCPTLSKQ